MAIEWTGKHALMSALAATDSVDAIANAGSTHLAEAYGGWHM
jgi:hypothetical protein